MTDDQQRARELLAAEYRKTGCHLLADDILLGRTFAGDTAIAAITAALRAAPEGFVMVRKEAIDWLNGESEEGFECPPERYFLDAEPRYWWRSVFREKAGLAARPQAAE